MAQILLDPDLHLPFFPFKRLRVFIYWLIKVQVFVFEVHQVSFRCSVEKMDVEKEDGDENVDPEQKDHRSPDTAGTDSWRANT